MEYIEKVSKRVFYFDPIADKMIQREREKNYVIDFDENTITMTASDYIELRDAYFDLLNINDDMALSFAKKFMNDIKENKDNER